MSEFVVGKRGGVIYIPSSVKDQYLKKEMTTDSKNPEYHFVKGSGDELAFEPVIRDGVVVGKIFVGRK